MKIRSKSSKSIMRTTENDHSNNDEDQIKGWHPTAIDQNLRQKVQQRRSDQIFEIDCANYGKRPFKQRWRLNQGLAPYCHRSNPTAKILRRRSNQGLAPYCHRSKSNGKSPGDQIAGTILPNLRCGYYHEMTDINQCGPSTSINRSQLIQLVISGGWDNE